MSDATNETSDATRNLPAVRQDIAHAGDSSLDHDDLAALERAVRSLEHSNIATRIANTIGRQLGSLTRYLPIGVSGIVNAAAERALRSALSVALRSLDDPAPSDNRLVRRLSAAFAGNSRLLHKAAVAASGAAGGAFGIASLPVELPLSTVIILRSIADIARDEGEDLSDPTVGIACLEVFALGARDNADDNFTDSGYFAVRGLLARTVSEASRYVLAQGLSDAGSPILVRLIAQIGSRFGIVVSEKLAAQAMPVIGAAGGAVVNYAFAEHFQSLAFGHFTVRRLERRYGKEIVRAEYDRLLDLEKAAA